jgi:hypothetical protein
MSDFKMTPVEFADLRALTADIGQSDVRLGRVLEAIVLHVGRSYGLDPAEEDARLKAEELVKSRAEEDEAVKSAADILQKSRAIEDAQPLTPAQVTARADEDARLQAAADERKRVRAEEDDRAKQDEQGQQPATPDVSTTPLPSSTASKYGRSTSNA